MTSLVAQDHRTEARVKKNPPKTDRIGSVLSAQKIRIGLDRFFVGHDSLNPGGDYAEGTRTRAAAARQSESSQHVPHLTCSAKRPMIPVQGAGDVHDLCCETIEMKMKGM
jgi:hypothetical protein